MLEHAVLGTVARSQEALDVSAKEALAQGGGATTGELELVRSVDVCEWSKDSTGPLRPSFALPLIIQITS